MSKSRRRNTTTTALLALGAAAMLALVWWDRRQPTDHRALVAGAALAQSWSLQRGTTSQRFVRSGDGWLVEHDNGRRVAANAAAIEALLAELELATVLGEAPPQPAASLVATIAVEGTKLSIYGAAVDGTFVERCGERVCRPLVVHARFDELLNPTGGWIAAPDAGQAP